ncbi:hypothetical protein AcW1_003919 [Taiwanofungus camphoratus]|nr:hypothetical protein AcW1_003919 [Antrodia cinnamomea]
MTSPLPEFDASLDFKFSQPPNPSWTYGQGVDATPDGKQWLDGENAGWKVVDAATEDPAQLYALLVSGVVPRPIAFVSTVSEDGVENLAPFSWFNMVASTPPVISVSCLNPAGRAKDTTRNIRATRGFTVSIISEPLVQHANVCATDAPAHVSEWPLSGLTKAPSIHVKAPRVKESAFSMECELFHALDIVDPATGAAAAPTTLVLGRVLCVHVRRDVLTARGRVDPARMGDITYARQGAAFRLGRPAWDAQGEAILEALAVQGTPGAEEGGGGAGRCER